VFPFNLVPRVVSKFILGLHCGGGEKDQEQQCAFEMHFTMYVSITIGLCRRRTLRIHCGISIHYASPKSLRHPSPQLPVRRNSHPSPARTMELVIKEIHLFSLVSPKVSFTLEKTGKSRDGELNHSRMLHIPQVLCSSRLNQPDISNIVHF